MAAERVDGVRKAEFAYPQGTGIVTYDTTTTTDSAIVVQVERATGFDLTVRHPSPAGH